MVFSDEIVLKEVNKGEAARYLGYRDTLPDIEMTKLILTVEQKLLEVIKPRFCYQTFDLSREHGLYLSGTALELKGASIAEFLEGCDKAAILCATLSDGVDTLLRSYEIENMVNALILDALSNAAIEQVCDLAEERIFQNWKDWNHTLRYGVGYGDFPLTLQGKILKIMDANKKIGLYATESSILVPRKSVTCVIGMYQGKPKKQKYSCSRCHLIKDCDYLKKGTTCYGENQ